MSQIVFDGADYAVKLKREIAPELTAAGWDLGRKVRLVSILNPDYKSAVVYTGIKTRRARELGVAMSREEVLNYRFKAKNKPTVTDVVGVIQRLNKDDRVDGIIIQLPLTGDRAKDQELCNMIAPQKDVDGLREDSKFVPATVRAVEAILKEAQRDKGSEGQRLIVVGSEGNIGSRLVKELGAEGMDKNDFDADKLRQADVIISVTGQPELIRGDIVKDGVIAIDVGWPKGDFEFASVMPKTSFITPVPGGVGPVTVMMLFQNLAQAVRTRK